MFAAAAATTSSATRKRLAEAGQGDAAGKKRRTVGAPMQERVTRQLMLDPEKCWTQMNIIFVTALIIFVTALIIFVTTLIISSPHS